MLCSAILGMFTQKQVFLGSFKPKRSTSARTLGCAKELRLHNSVLGSSPTLRSRLREGKFHCARKNLCTRADLCSCIAPTKFSAAYSQVSVHKTAARIFIRSKLSTVAWKPQTKGNAHSPISLSPPYLLQVFSCCEYKDNSTRRCKDMSTPVLPYLASAENAEGVKI